MFAVEGKTSLEQSSGCFSLFFFLNLQKETVSFIFKNMMYYGAVKFQHWVHASYI